MLRTNLKSLCNNLAQAPTLSPDPNSITLNAHLNLGVDVSKFSVKQVSGEGGGKCLALVPAVRRHYRPGGHRTACCRHRRPSCPEHSARRARVKAIS